MAVKNTSANKNTTGSAGKKTGGSKSGGNSKNGGRGNSGKSSGTRKSTGSKKSSAKKKTSSGIKPVRTYTEEEKQELLRERGLRNEIKDETVLIITGVISILLVLSNFKMSGKVGEAVSGVLFGLFGFLAYLVPVFLIVVVAFYLANKKSVTRLYLSKLISSVIIFLLIAAMIQLAVGNTTPTTKLTEYFMFAKENKTGGGLVGGLLCRVLVPFFGLVGTWVVLAALELICLMVITGKAFLQLLKEYFADRHKENVSRRKEMDEIYKEMLRDEDSGDIVPEKKSRSKSYLFDFGDKKTDGAEEKKEEPKIRNFFGGVTPTTPVGLASDRKDEPAQDESEVIIPVDIKKHTESIPSRDTAAEVISSRHTTTANSYSGMQEIIGEDAAGNEKTEMSFSETALRDRANFEAASPRSIFDNEPYGGKIGKGSKAGVGAGRPSAAGNRSEAANAEGTKTEKTDNGKIVESAGNQPAPAPEKIYKFPPITLLKGGAKKGGGNWRQEAEETSDKLERALQSFGVNVEVTNIVRGPSVTRFELKPEEGVRVSRITNLADDIKLKLAAADIRIEAPIPGKDAVGIEVPNSEKSAVSIKEMIDCEEFKDTKASIPFVVGMSIDGQRMIGDIAKMPHMLIAGATGSGKSVCINTIVMSILYKSRPDEIKFIMIDPKIVELSVYNGIPHLLIPVVTDPKKAASALNWACVEMDERYKKFAQLSVRDLKSYNERVKAEAAKGNVDPEYKEMPKIVIIVDELADLMMVASGDVEDAICRLAQKARACGIHLIIATQRPSVNVITGIIKANIPSRIAFAVTSGVDSKTILDTVGAEKLLGKGDMLYFPSGLPKPVRIQGAYVSDEEINSVVDFLRSENEAAQYNDDISDHITKAAENQGTQSKGVPADEDDGRDEYFAEAGKMIIEKEKASIGFIQRAYKVGFNRAARIMDQLAEAGVVSQEDGTKPRQILMTVPEFEAMLSNKNTSAS
ncbi:MAG: DNA translocase FtsK [Lachnospiraceae bacterium]|nr:DNA translocase FtsK [Lachnospiraceae bacterium]